MWELRHKIVSRACRTSHAWTSVNVHVLYSALLFVCLQVIHLIFVYLLGKTNLWTVSYYCWAMFATREAQISCFVLQRQRRKCRSCTETPYFFAGKLNERFGNSNKIAVLIYATHLWLLPNTTKSWMSNNTFIGISRLINAPAKVLLYLMQGWDDGRWITYWKLLHAAFSRFMRTVNAAAALHRLLN